MGKVVSSFPSTPAGTSAYDLSQGFYTVFFFNCLSVCLNLKIGPFKILWLPTFCKSRSLKMQSCGRQAQRPPRHCSGKWVRHRKCMIGGGGGGGDRTRIAAEIEPSRTAKTKTSENNPVCFIPCFGRVQSLN